MQTQTIVAIKKDLWGDLKSDNRVVDPLILLEEQAALLSQKTNGIVYNCSTPNI